MRGQVSTEYLIIIGAILVVLIPLFYYAVQETNKNIRINQAGDVVNTLAQKTETVYSLGEGTRDYVWVTIPSGVYSTLVFNKTLQISFSNLGDITAFTRINVSGSIPKDQGTYRVIVEALEGTVFIGAVNDTNPPNVIGVSPSGKITVSSTTLGATTDEAARCKYDTSDEDYASMSSIFEGGGISHVKSLQNLTDGSYLYYARCIDYFNNVMSSSAVINFSVEVDSSIPVVSNVGATKKNVVAGSSVCVNASVSDDSIDQVWAMMTTPFNSPLPKVVNYTLSDSSSCSGSNGDGRYGNNIVMQAPGVWILNTAYANDTAGNLGFQIPFPNIEINVTANTSVGPGQGLTYVFPDAAFYFKTPSGGGFNTSDSAMNTLSNVLIDVTDDDKNTPASAKRFYYTDVGNVFEGFIMQLNKSKYDYSYISIRIKAVDSDVIPYNLSVYAYKDDNNILSANSTNFLITDISNPGFNRGYNEYIVTDTVNAGASSYIRLRIVPKTDMKKKQAHLSELDFGVA